MPYKELSDSDVDRVAQLLALQFNATQRPVEHTFTVVAKTMSNAPVLALASDQIYELQPSDFNNRLWPTLRDAILHAGRQVAPPSRLDIQSRPSAATELNDFIWKKSVLEQKIGTAFAHYKRRYYQLTLIETKQ